MIDGRGPRRVDRDGALCGLRGMRLDSVMPKDGACARIPIVPSAQCQRGMEYEVANAQTIPCVGERRLEIWTHGMTAPRGMVIQCADVHKPLLSLSRCADPRYESCIGRTCGYLLDCETGEVIPLARKGNLYTLRVWVRAARTRHEPTRTPHDPALHSAG